MKTPKIPPPPGMTPLGLPIKAGTMLVSAGRCLAVDHVPWMSLSIVRNDHWTLDPVSADALAHYLAKKFDAGEFAAFLETYRKS